jgi:hypothetical protein
MFPKVAFVGEACYHGLSFINIERISWTKFGMLVKGTEQNPVYRIYRTTFIYNAAKFEVVENVFLCGQMLNLEN